MEPFADMMCELSVNIHCETCKVRIMECLSSISGVYSITIDGQRGNVRVEGQVDPNILIRALVRTDEHAKLKWVKLKHSQVGRGNFSYGPRNYFFESMGPNRYGPRGDGSSWYEPPEQYHHYSRRSPYVDYPFSTGRNYNFGPFGGPRW